MDGSLQPLRVACAESARRAESVVAFGVAFVAALALARAAESTRPPALSVRSATLSAALSRALQAPRPLATTAEKTMSAVLLRFMIPSREQVVIGHAGAEKCTSRAYSQRESRDQAATSLSRSTVRAA